MKLGIFLFTILLSLNVLGQQKIYVNNVNNLIKVGVLTNNKQLSLGVKNVLEEALQDKGYELVSDKWDAELLIDVDIVYFDYEQTKSNLSVFHKDENAVIVKMRGVVTKDGQIVKDVLVTDQSKELVSSTGIVASDGKFSSTMVRNAVKKTCVLVVTKLF